MEHERRRTTLTVLTAALAIAFAVGGIGVAAGATNGDAASAQVDGESDRAAVLDATAGSGTASDPHVVTNATELQAMAAEPGAHYVLGADVDASATAGWNGGDGFAPVGSAAAPFAGTFDGRDHEITGLTIDRRGEVDLGLFGNVSADGSVTDVRLVDADVRGGTIEDFAKPGRVGAIAGASAGRVANVSVDGTVASRTDLVGGVVGRNDGTVADATADVAVRGGNVVGGLVGDNRGAVVRSSANGTTIGTQRSVGGLAGSNTGNVTRSAARGDVVGANVVGGLVGLSGDPGRTGVTGTTAIRESYATGDVAGEDAVGGLVGEVAGQHGRTLVVDSYAVGDVNGSDRVGGLAGSNGGVLRRSYAAGTVTAPGDAGGLVGYEDSTLLDPERGPRVVEDAYWVRAATDRSTSANGTAVSVAAATGPDAGASLDGFDFGSTWTTTDGYPILAWQDGAHGGVGERVRAVARATTEVEDGADLALNGTASVAGGAAIESYEWEIGDRRATGARATVAAPAPGRYAARLTITTADGHTATDERPVRVVDDADANAPPEVDLTAGSTTLTTSPSRSIALVGLAARSARDPDGYVAEYDWEFGGDGSRIGSGPYELRAYRNPGTYEVTVTVTDDDGATANASTEVTVTEDEPDLMGGNGTATDPYRVGSVEELQAVGRDLDAHYVLTDDVDASATRDWNVDVFDEPNGFEPIGDGSNPDRGERAAAFEGTFDGRGHAIEGLYVDRQNGGLFGRVGPTGRVEDVHLEMADGSDVEGGLAAVNEGTVANASVRGTFRGEGGLVGQSEANSTVRDSWADVRLAGRGGLVGSAGGTVRDSWSTGVVGTDGEGQGGLVGSGGDVIDSWSNATVEGREHVGGLVGVSRGDVRRSRASGDVNGTEAVGGLVGHAGRGLIRRSHATGTVTGERAVGGLVGDSVATVERSYATGDVRWNGVHQTVDEGSAIGGLVGLANRDTVGDVTGSIADSYATGDVGGKAGVGALVGRIAGGEVRRSYAVGLARGESDVGGIAGARGELDPATPGRTHWGVAATGDLDALAEREAWRATDGYPELAHEDGEWNEPADALPSVSVPAHVTNRSVTLDASGSYADAGVATFVWSIEGETIDGDPVDREYRGERATHAFAEPGDYDVTLTVTSESGRTDAVSGPLTVDRGLGELAGNGTADDPYRIETARDLRTIDRDLDARYVLANDVDASETARWNDGAGMESLATNGDRGTTRVLEPSDEGPFLGTIDGQGHAVSNLTLADEFLHWSGNETVLLAENRSGVEDPATAEAGRVTDLTLRNVSAPNSATLIHQNDGTVSNVTVSGTAADAGLVATNGGLIVDSGAAVDVDGRGSRNVGGLVGENNGVVRRSRATGDVAGERAVGGLVGWNYDGLVTESWASGDVDGTERVGGLAGGTANGTLLYSDASGIERSYATGEVSGTAAVGGLVGGSRGSLEAVYATGRVRGDERVGGLVGANLTRYGDDPPATASHAYWDAVTSGQDASVNGTGLTTDRMTGEDARESMDGFDFGETWETTGGYPVLAANDRRTAGRDGPAVDVYLSPRREAIDEQVNASIVASSVPEGVGGYVLEVAVANDSVARIENASVGDGFVADESVRYGPDGATVTIETIGAGTANGSDGDEVELASVALRTTGPGTAAVDVRVERLVDGEGRPVVPATSSDTLQVADVTTEPIDGVEPQDADADWKYEDLNANDRVDIGDAVILFRHRNDPAVADHVAAYDFDDSGVVSIGDAVVLFREAVA